MSGLAFEVLENEALHVVCLKGRSIILGPILSPFDLHISKRHIFAVLAVDANRVVSVEAFAPVEFIRG